MSSLSILVLMPLTHEHRYMMMLLLFGMCLGASVSRLLHKGTDESTAHVFISPNSVFLIHPEFEEDC
uniref:Uncharacterized protein n=1 Tax=Arundo donax TaxID=35708 RepID=A0A0A9FLI1_ARUDO